MTDNARKRLRRQTRSLALGREFRLLQPRNLEVRSAVGGPDGSVVLSGEAIVYNTWYEVPDVWGTFYEQVASGAAAGPLARGVNVGLFVNHDIAAVPLASTVSGMLTITDTPSALRFEALIDPRMSLANDLIIGMERGDISQVSVGFEVDPANGGADEWALTGNQEYRTITAFSDFFDISACTFPCSPTTSIALAQRSLTLMAPESRARLNRLWGIAKEVREGKVLSQANGQELMAALEALHAADDIDIPSIVESLQTIDAALDAGQAGVAAVLAVADPDGDADDLEPALVPADDEDDEDSGPEARSRALEALAIEREAVAVRTRRAA